MIKRGQRAQIQISFGMIFSILIIIATVAVAFYVIRFFLGIQQCVDAGFLFERLRTSVDDAWKKDIANIPFSSDVPAGVEAVCFGNMTIPVRNPDDNTKRNSINNDIKSPGSQSANVHIYPPKAGCEKSLPYFKLEHAKMEKFFCAGLDRKGNININITKGSFDALVTIKP